MSSMVENKELEIASRRFEQNIAKYPIEEQFAVGAISKNVIFGCPWEFVSLSSDLREIMDALNSSKHCGVYKVSFAKSRDPRNKGELKRSYGYLVYMDFNYVCQLLSREAPGLIDKKVLSHAAEKKKSSVLSLAGLLDKESKKQAAVSGASRVLRIGIYGTNGSQTISVNGSTFPAFAINLQELCEICQRYGYGLLRDNPEELSFDSKLRVNVPKNSILPPARVIQNGLAYMSELMVAPSRNALFVDLARIQ